MALSQDKKLNLLLVKVNESATNPKSNFDEATRVEIIKQNSDCKKLFKYNFKNKLSFVIAQQTFCHKNADLILALRWSHEL